MVEVYSIEIHAETNNIYIYIHLITYVVYKVFKLSGLGWLTNKK